MAYPSKSYHVRTWSPDRYHVECDTWFIDRHGEKDARTDQVGPVYTDYGDALDARRLLVAAL